MVRSDTEDFGFSLHTVPATNSLKDCDLGEQRKLSVDLGPEKQTNGHVEQEGSLMLGD